MAKGKTAEAEETVAEVTEKDYTAYVTKAPGALYDHLLGWIKEKSGVTFASAKEEKAFDLGVKLTLALRTHHQASPENQERLAEAAAAREAAAEEAAKAPKAPKVEEAAKAPKGAPKKAPAAAAPAEKAAPAKPGPKKVTAAAGKGKAPF